MYKLSTVNYRISTRHSLERDIDALVCPDIDSGALALANGSRISARAPEELAGVVWHVAFAEGSVQIRITRGAGPFPASILCLDVILHGNIRGPGLLLADVRRGY